MLSSYLSMESTLDFTREGIDVKNWNRCRGHPVIAALVVVVALVVAVATTVDAVRHDSWQPVLSIGWLPAVLVAGLYPTDTRGCWPRLRARTRS